MRHARARELQEVALVEPLALHLSPAFFVHGAIGRRRRHDPAVGLAEDGDAVSRRSPQNELDRLEEEGAIFVRRQRDLGYIGYSGDHGAWEWTGLRSHPCHRVRVDHRALRVVARRRPSWRAHLQQNRWTTLTSAQSSEREERRGRGGEEQGFGPHELRARLATVAEAQIRQLLRTA